jgi:gluconokinase
MLLSALSMNVGHLSLLTDVRQPRHGLLPEFIRRWKGLKTIPWFPAIADGAAANLGSGCHHPARVALTIGTSCAVRIVTSDPVEEVPPGLWCYRVDHRRSIIGGALSDGGSLFAWMTAAFKLGSPEQLARALAAMAPDAHGLTVLPFFSGERSPGWADHARATFHGLSLATTPVDMLRAGLEAVAYRIGEIYKRLDSIIPDDADVVASGGALRRSPVWAQILADVLGRPIAVSGVREVSSRGAALLALESLGMLAGLDIPPPLTGKWYRPNRAHHVIYRKAIERQQRLYNRLVADRLTLRNHITNPNQP